MSFSNQNKAFSNGIMVAITLMLNLFSHEINPVEASRNSLEQPLMVTKPDQVKVANRNFNDQKMKMASSTAADYKEAARNSLKQPLMVIESDRVEIGELNLDHHNLEMVNTIEASKKNRKILSIINGRNYEDNLSVDLPHKSDPIYSGPNPCTYLPINDPRHCPNT